MDTFQALICTSFIIGLAQGAAIDLSSCGQSKVCMGIPSNCITSNSTACKAIATWAPQGTKIAFELSTKTDGWVALGTLEGTGSDGMSPATVMDCIRSSSTISLGYSKNTGLNNAAISGTDGLVLTSSEYAGGELRCFFTREKFISSSFPTFGGNNSYKALLAFGPVSGGVKQYHAERISTALPVNFDSNQQVTTDGTGNSGYNLVKAHACLMIFAWVMFASIGIMLARHYKDMWPGSMAGGKPIWFTGHVVCQILATILTILGFIVIFSHKKGWSYLEGEDRVTRAHPYLGTLVTICAILNPIMAMCRPDPNAPSRWLFNLLHWIVGFTAQVLGLLMIFVGLKLKISDPIKSNWMLILLLVFVIIYFLIDVILLIIRCMPASKARTSSEIEMRGNGEGPSNNDGPQKPPGSALRTFFIVVVVLGSTIVTLAVVIGIGEK